MTMTPMPSRRAPFSIESLTDGYRAEVERAIDNLYKSGKMPMFGVPGMPPVPGVPRRDSMPPMGGRPYGGGEFGKSALPPAAAAARRRN